MAKRCSQFVYLFKKVRLEWDQLNQWMGPLKCQSRLALKTSMGGAITTSAGRLFHRFTNFHHKWVLPY